MLSNELINFCNRWLDKADTYTNNSTEEVFDKFFSLYVVYNAIYSEATLKLKEKNSKISAGDRISATENISKYIGHQILFEKLQNLSKEINKIIELIKNGTFYISTKRDNITPDTEQDNKYITDIEMNKTAIKSNDKQEFNKAILNLIYGVRCNMFHGKKGFNPIQRELLIPMNNILEMIIKDLLLISQEGGR